MTVQFNLYKEEMLMEMFGFLNSFGLKKELPKTIKTMDITFSCSQFI